MTPTIPPGSRLYGLDMPAIQRVVATAQALEAGRLDEAQSQLAGVLTRFPDQIDGTGWDGGTPVAYVRELVDYWRDGYDWRAQEARLNRWRQFSVPLGGIDLHFIHEPGVGPAPLPLLLSHGWPGSIVEFERIIPMLTGCGCRPLRSRWISAGTCCDSATRYVTPGRTRARREPDSRIPV